MGQRGDGGCILLRNEPPLYSEATLSHSFPASIANLVLPISFLVPIALNLDLPVLLFLHCHLVLALLLLHELEKVLLVLEEMDYAWVKQNTMILCMTTHVIIEGVLHKSKNDFTTLVSCSSPHRERFFTIFLNVRVRSLSNDYRVSSSFVSPIDRRSESRSWKERRSDTLSELRSSSKELFIVGGLMIVVMGFFMFSFK